MASSSAGCWARGAAQRPRRITGWKRIAPAIDPARNRTWPGNATQLAETGTARAAAEAQRAAAEKLLAEQRAAARTELARGETGAGQGAGGFAGSLQGAERGCAEANRAGISAAGRTRVSASSRNPPKATWPSGRKPSRHWSKPLKQQLETYQKRLQQSETAQSTTLGEVKKQLETLALQSQSLAQRNAAIAHGAAVQPGARPLGRGNLAPRGGGRRHERALRFQRADPGRRQQAGPDRAPAGRPHHHRGRQGAGPGFSQRLDGADPAKRAESLAAHAAKLKATIKALADRDYPAQFPNALDYVVLFLPAESLFSAALEGDHDLIVWAASKRILLATPASLIALLRSVSVSWQQHAQTENAQKIADAAQELYPRVCKFTEHFEKIRDGLEKANKAFNDAVGSYDSRIRPAG